MTRGDYLTAALLAQYVILSAVSATEEDFAKAVYWLGAAVITSALLMM